MPAESRRFQHRLRSRDRCFLWGAVAATAVGVPVGALVASGKTTETPNGCVRTVRAGVMGGATFEYCGKRAVAFCRQSGTTGADLSAECRDVLRE